MESKTVRANRGMSIDLEYGFFNIEKGRTYTDDGTTILMSMSVLGLIDGSFVRSRSPMRDYRRESPRKPEAPWLSNNVLALGASYLDEPEKIQDFARACK